MYSIEDICLQFHMIVQLHACTVQKRTQNGIHLTNTVPDFQTGMSSVPDPRDSTCSFRPCSDRQSWAWRVRSVPAPRQSPDKKDGGTSHSHQCERGQLLSYKYEQIQIHFITFRPALIFELNIWRANIKVHGLCPDCRSKNLRGKLSTFCFPKNVACCSLGVF
jgi:hypothetical protein